MAFNISIFLENKLNAVGNGYSSILPSKYIYIQWITLIIKGIFSFVDDDSKMFYHLTHSGEYEIICIYLIQFYKEKLNIKFLSNNNNLIH